MKIKVIVLLLISLFILNSKTYAIDLIEVYKDALSGDPSYQEARARWLSDKEAVAISRSSLLPRLNFGADIEAYRSDSSDNSFSGNTTQQYSVIASQPIFNLEAWQNLQSSKASIKASFAMYSAAYQDLLFRVARFYFAILEAEEILHFTKAKKNSIALQLARTKESFRQGLAVITDLHQIQSDYDDTYAEQITAANDLANKKEALCEITGKLYNKLSGLKNLSLTNPNPDDINKWVSVASKQNYDLLSSYYILKAKHEEVKTRNSGHFPTINLEGRASYLKSVKPTITATGDYGSRNRSVGVGINLDFPVIKGGLVSAQTKQAIHQYEGAQASFIKTKRSVISKTRKDYLGLASIIAKIKADRQAVRSAKASFKSTKAGHEVGIQMMVDVLAAQAKFYETKVRLAKDKYSYILKTLSLKFDAGVLDERDIVAINGWLAKEKTTKVFSREKKNKTSKGKILRKKLNGSAKDLFAKNPDYYTLQLMASKNRDDLIEYARNNKSNERYYIYSVRKDGKVWYRLIKGDYKTYQKAALIASKQSVAPWIRKYSSIQRDLNYVPG